jgi:hypothetical protein
MGTDESTAAEQPSAKKTTAEILKEAHKTAAEQAKSHLPALEAMEIIQLVAGVARKEKGAAENVKKFALKFADAGGVYARAFARVSLDDVLRDVQQGHVRELADTDFSTRMVECVERIGRTVHEYCAGSINDMQLIERLGNTEIKQIAKDFWTALEVCPAQAALPPAELADAALPVMAYAACMAAYQELQGALDEEIAAREDRLRIEAQCQDSIEAIRRYRMEMDAAVSRYLSSRIEIFTAGFSAMDQAILAGDSNGYLTGNAQIQEILGYHAQFSNQQEFDELMDADTAFKL